MVHNIDNHVYGVYSFMKSTNVIKILKQNGWKKHHQRGSHLQLKHPYLPGKVTVPHPKKDLPIKTLASIFKQAKISKG